LFFIAYPAQEGNQNFIKNWQYVLQFQQRTRAVQATYYPVVLCILLIIALVAAAQVNDFVEEEAKN
jgi:hypothetical protein